MDERWKVRIVKAGRSFAFQLAGLVLPCVGTGCVAAAAERWQPQNAGMGWSSYLWIIPVLVAVCVAQAFIVALVAIALRWPPLEDRRLCVLVGLSCGLGAVPLLFPSRVGGDVQGLAAALLFAVLVRFLISRRIGH